MSSAADQGEASKISPLISLTNYLSALVASVSNSQNAEIALRRGYNHKANDIFDEVSQDSPDEAGKYWNWGREQIIWPPRLTQHGKTMWNRKRETTQEMKEIIVKVCTVLKHEVNGGLHDEGDELGEDRLEDKLALIEQRVRNLR